jgi:hypothetical protein
MRLIPSDPDVATIYSRIENGDLNLRPDFQRGEVWSPSKKQKLIDSILREWHVPPVHVVQGVNGDEDEVLDGQQRLVSIRDFIEGKIRVNGNIEPFDSSIEALDGYSFKELPAEWRRKFMRFPIRVFSIVDFLPSEPSELFYRLNQPVSLTAAEQRNSFFGKPREQIKELVGVMEDAGINKEFLGFSNSRMAYDDVLARVCVALENGLAAKVSANLLADRYRSGIPFDEVAYSRVRRSILFLSEARSNIFIPSKLNKASLFSWLVFVCRLLRVSPKVSSYDCAEFFSHFELNRLLYSDITPFDDTNDPAYSPLYEIYSDRVTSRVADVSSVVLRDIALWGIYLAAQGFSSSYKSKAVEHYQMFLKGRNISRGVGELDLLEFAFDAKVEWGQI